MNAMRIDWLDKLNALLQTAAACLVVSAIFYSLQPNRSFEVPVVYSMCIGFFTWALIDFGRHIVSGESETGWPQGATGVLFSVGSIVSGYVLGITAADVWFGRTEWSITKIASSGPSLVISIVVSAAVSFYFYSRGKGQYLERRVQEVSDQAAEARLRLLEAQLEPHMLFNTLANLRVLIGVDPARAQTMLDRMVAYLRATLAASRATSHTLEQEFARLEDYLELMAIRMGPRLRYTLDLPDSLRSKQVPPLILQSLVENSIQHGLEPQVEGGSITVRASLQSDAWTLVVEDTGLGYAPNAAHHIEGHGFGLAQVRERLASTFGKSAAMKFEAPHAGGTRAVLTFSIK